MAPTWREERPEAITAASHRAERPCRSMVTIFSALSSSSEVRMRLSRSLCGVGFLTGAATAFFTTGFFGASFLGASFFAGCFAGFLAVCLAGFFAGCFFATFVLAADFLTVFLAALRVRARIL